MKAQKEQLYMAKRLARSAADNRRIGAMHELTKLRQSGDYGDPRLIDRAADLALKGANTVRGDSRGLPKLAPSDEKYTLFEDINARIERELRASGAEGWEDD